LDARIAILVVGASFFVNMPEHKAEHVVERRI
jgi:hypothetical protein